MKKAIEQAKTALPAIDGAGQLSAGGGGIVEPRARMDRPALGGLDDDAANQLGTRVRGSSQEDAARLGIGEAEYAKRLLESSLSTGADGLSDANAASIDPTIALFKRWDKEDETSDPDEIARREAEFEEFKDGMNRNRLEAGGPNAKDLSVSQSIFLDSGLLGLLTQRVGVKTADACRAWLAAQLSSGNRFIVPEIVDFELRRELLRAGKSAAVQRLDDFIAAETGRYLPLNTSVMRQAAQLWADLRNKGLPTTDPKELDVDVILAAQALGTGLLAGQIVVATSNPSHLSRLVPAQLWSEIS